MQASNGYSKREQYITNNITLKIMRQHQFNKEATVAG
jgi:hypothetical protein